MDDIILVILTHLPVDCCIKYQIVCKKWRQRLTSQSHWKAKCREYWPNYPLDGIGDYFQLFLDRGGAHFITTFEQFRRIYNEVSSNGKEDLRHIPHLTIAEPGHLTFTLELKRANGLRLLFTRFILREEEYYDNFDLFANYDEKKNKMQLDEYWSEIQKTVRHPNVYVPVRWFRYKDYLFLLHETSIENSFWTFLMEDNRFGQFSEKKLAKVVQDLLLGAKHLSDRGIYMLDVNITYDTKDDWMEHKLFDFGFSFTERSPMRLSYIPPPELGFRSGYYATEKTDAAATNIWTIGSFLYRLLMDDHPYNANIMRRYQLMEKQDVVFPEDDDIAQQLSADIKDLIVKMYKFKPNRRMSLDDALNHPWFQTAPSKFLEIVHDRLSEDYSSYKQPHHFVLFNDLIEN